MLFPDRENPSWISRHSTLVFPVGKAREYPVLQISIPRSRAKDPVDQLQPATSLPPIQFLGALRRCKHPSSFAIASPHYPMVSAAQARLAI
jgi:hypothetical protein